MYFISKEFRFEAAHQLKLPYPSKCNSLHGHSYAVRLVMGAHREHLENGMVIDYTQLAPFGDYIDQNLDHKNLNEIIDIPTAEMIAFHLFQAAVKLFEPANQFERNNYYVVRVEVSETSKTWASYGRQ